MKDILDRSLAILLTLLVVLAPLPIGSNREWSWSLCALLAGVLTLIWAAGRLRRPRDVFPGPPIVAVLLFLLAVFWAVVQQAPWTPASWHHPLWGMTAEALGEPVAGRVSLSADDTWTAVMRLLGYALVFFLALQLGRARERARAMFGWLTIAGLAYAVFGLFVYWGGYEPHWLFGVRTLPHDVRSTFINRNHFATWEGLSVVCAIAWFYQRMSNPSLKPYETPTDRQDQVEAFVLGAWKPMMALLLMVTALVLTHSRGGFAASLAGVIALLLLLDRRAGRGRVVSRVTVVTALAVAGIAFYLTSQVLLDRIDRTDLTNEERFAVYADVERAIGDNPVLGFGYGTFANGFRIYDQLETPVQYDRAHNTWLENAFDLGVPFAVCLYLSLAWLAWYCLRGVRRRHRDWVFPAAGVAASVLVGVHALVDFSLQLPAVAMLYATILGVGVAQSYSSLKNGK